MTSRTNNAAPEPANSGGAGAWIGFAAHAAELPILDGNGSPGTDGSGLIFDHHRGGATFINNMGENPSATATIRVTAGQRGRVRYLREVVATTLADRVATLPVTIEWLCLDQVTQGGDGAVASTRPDGETCVAGRCASTRVDSAQLED